MKDTIFISHATPTDNIFATWLATKLELCGYKVWVDLNDLAPSVDFWNTIDQTIRNDAVKFIFVMSNASIDPNRDGVQKELAVADKIRRQNPNFIVPVRIDNVSYNDLPVEILRLNAIDFYNDWAKGLETLLKYLNDENIVKVMSNTDSQHYIDRWFSSQTKLRSQTVDNEDEYCSNLFALDLPESVFIYKREDVEEALTTRHIPMKKNKKVIVRAIYNKIACPIQVMLESTLQFQPKDGSDEYNSDMKAHLAWTHSSSLYYKLGCLPWKLDAVREGVCYVGLVFKKLQDTGKQKGYACSAAQMFLDSGDGVVFRGNIGPWISKNEKTFHLDRTSAKALLSIAIDAYYDKHKSYPKELFIHGRTAFTNDEWNGFQDAANISPTTNLVGVAIREKSGLRLLKDNTDPKSQYGILRGLCLYVDEKSGYLWTKGFIPKTETANHLEVACPLHIEINRGQADIKTVMRDILALTKLNYNACLYGDGLPVTLRFSDKIGDILTAIPDVNWAAKPFKYYI